MTEEFFNRATYAASVMAVAHNVTEFLDEFCVDDLPKSLYEQVLDFGKHAREIETKCALYLEELRQNVK